MSEGFRVFAGRSCRRVPAVCWSSSLKGSSLSLVFIIGGFQVFAGAPFCRRVPAVCWGSSLKGSSLSLVFIIGGFRVFAGVAHVEVLPVFRWSLSSSKVPGLSLELHCPKDSSLSLELLCPNDSSLSLVFIIGGFRVFAGAPFCRRVPAVCWSSSLKDSGCSLELRFAEWFQRFAGAHL